MYFYLCLQEQAVGPSMSDPAVPTVPTLSTPGKQPTCSQTNHSCAKAANFTSACRCAESDVGHAVPASENGDLPIASSSAPQVEKPALHESGTGLTAGASVAEPKPGGSKPEGAEAVTREEAADMESPDPEPRRRQFPKGGNHSKNNQQISETSIGERRSCRADGDTGIVMAWLRLQISAGR